MSTKTTLIGPFRQLVTLDGLVFSGPLSDDQLQIIEEGGIVVENGKIKAIGKFKDLKPSFSQKVDLIEDDFVLLPGFVDAHTHICYGGTRAGDYALRNAGVSYLEIARKGGGIWDTVTKTREADLDQLANQLAKRAKRHLSEGVTTCEVKSGYGLDLGSEIKMLEAIKIVDARLKIDLIPTCLAAHIKPKDFEGSPAEYLLFTANNLFSFLKDNQLSNRIDIFIEESAFSTKEAASYLHMAQQYGFSITVHADQFSTGGSEIAAKFGAISADHLEASGEKEFKKLIKADVIGTALPGASLGLGEPFMKGRKFLDMGGCLVIATDWNPGSAPMGDLLMQAAVYGAHQKLTTAETFAAITGRAAKALQLEDRGILKQDYLADFVAFPTNDYREILYHQGKMKPEMVWKNGNLIPNSKTR
ncbi:imidazolonepropionase [Flexithrix dorotheae]|uniref:imidazolonepropionase n=1 Tax=Flexithrix dorotheae TaxID=70993 RepID=UPI00036BA428|nr:imidazolonepropionase [Flexithrix dorotheae]